MDRADMISKVFGDVDAVSPFDMVKVLSKMSDGPKVSPDLGKYCTRTMKMFRKMVRDSEIPEYSKVSAGCQECSSVFILAHTSY